MTRIDVAVPCYNYARFLRDCVSSILGQEGVVVRVLIVDNASEDDTLAVARTIAAEDRRVEVLPQAVNRGASASYNEGIEWAEAEYFLILDADDMLAPGALARAARVLEESPGIAFLHGVEARLEAEGSVRAPRAASPAAPPVVRPGPEFIRRLCRTPVNSIGANTVVRRTSAQKRVGHYRAALPYTDDLEMWLRLATAGSVACLKSVQAIRRYHSDRMSVHYQSEQTRDFIERERAFVSFFAHEGRALIGAEAMLADARVGLGEHAYWSAVSHLVRGQGRVAADLLALSRAWRPGRGLIPPFGWVMRMDRPIERAVEIVAEALPFPRKLGRTVTMTPAGNSRDGA
jgi:glycosyltransferase involved in cell wall biosynthesis